MSWISGEFVIDSISQQSLAKARAQIVDRVRHNADLEEFSNMGEDIGNITPIYPPESCCRSLRSVEEWYKNSYEVFHRPYQKYIPFLDTDSLPNNKRLLTLRNDFKTKLPSEIHITMHTMCKICRLSTLVASIVDQKSTKTTFTITVAQCATTTCCLIQYRSDWMRSMPELTA